MAKMGRPNTADYRKRNLRYARVEDSFIAALHRLESEKDRQIVLEVLEHLKQPKKTLNLFELE